MKAFTILEVVVSLLLSSIIIGMAISSQTMIRQQYDLFDKTTEENLKLLQLHNYLEYDIDKADIVHYDNKQLICTSPNYKVVYTLHTKYIKRRILNPIQKQDSLTISIQKIEPSFENKPIGYGAIDKLELQFNYYGTLQNLIYSKKYSAVQIMQIHSSLQN